MKGDLLVWLNEEIVPALLGLQMLHQHAEDDRNFVVAAITPKGGVRGDNIAGVNEGQPKEERAVIFCEMTALFGGNAENGYAGTAIWSRMVAHFFPVRAAWAFLWKA